MEECTGTFERKVWQISDIREMMAGSNQSAWQEAVLAGTIHTIRDFGDFSFLILADPARDHPMLC